VKDFAFKIHELVGDIKRVLVGIGDDGDNNDEGFDSSDYRSLDSSSSDSNGGAPQAETTSA
jgi:hypothetical protein